MMIELLSNKLILSVRLLSDMMFSEILVMYIRKKVVMIDMGIDMLMISVFLVLCRKRKSMMMVSRLFMIVVLMIVLIDLWM